MADSMGFSVDMGTFMANVKKMADKIPKADLSAELKVANEALRLSQAEVPHDEGTLQNSGAVEIIGGQVYVGYHSPYAAKLHENPQFRFQKGRKGKYLEDPINRNKDVLGFTYTNELARGLK